MIDDPTFFPILIASIANIVLGFVWYSPYVFGNVWMRLVGVTPEMTEKAKRTMPTALFVALVSGMVMAYVMYYFGGAWFVLDVFGAIELALWLWAGFVAPVLISSVLWEQKSLALYFINASFWLVAMIITAIVLVL